ncbi:hypothetical protein [Arsenicibacter rosenii]|uniref:Monoheme cytochrome C n=1 Tax=Arsenicibacter rosenii TaxID=1750698 RepID=A0A1S2VGX7_9BACT|nr:hypothetical protein [Arsenicibacter rosenii]OIN57456.1 hypothetical protein BLX24_19700 [Arsenicibacter rosenii]
MRKLHALLLTLGAAIGLAAFVQPAEKKRVDTMVVPEMAVADSVKKDPETGLAIDGQLMLVKAHCTSCHSPKLIIQNRFTRDGWKEKIRWMQRTQKLWDLGESEPKVLDYLVKYYGPEQKTFDGRRMPLKDVKWYELKSK